MDKAVSTLNDLFWMGSVYFINLPKQRLKTAGVIGMIALNSWAEIINNG